MPTLKLEAASAKRLVELLSTDDAFRERFVTDTAQAILDTGHVPESDAALHDFVKQCCSNIRLADKDSIAKAQKEIFAMLTSGTGYNVPMLEHGKGAPRTLR
ncbi:NHLP-related RiPP peptide [Stenotrophomonas rhizophila]|jgi:putative modified peptide|uniref:NHLP-related RiPP peptide n=1 Tax=Stenotrophomonas nematodicola TaxID=2656746 RepID=A0ABW7CWA5_9GAMM|nr:NHLP-related RiPP peptide [Stenotrophomonas sp. BIGb0135]MCS4235191.1 putative modified peptide [Stenotrophomonas sp. BIGb0135]